MGAGWKNRHVHTSARRLDIEYVGGGSQICRLDPVTGAVTELTASEEGTWDFRARGAPTEVE